MYLRQRVVREPYEAGYTLLELLVVLAIVSLLVLSAPTFYGHIVPNYQVRQLANDLAQIARTRRNDAMTSQQMAGLAFDAESNSLICLEQADTDDSRYVNCSGLDFPDGVSVLFEASMPWRLQDANLLLFYPNGASSGGTISVSRSGIASTIRIDWVSGAIEVEQS